MIVVTQGLRSVGASRAPPIPPPPVWRLLGPFRTLGCRGLGCSPVSWRGPLRKRQTTTQIRSQRMMTPMTQHPFRSAMAAVSAGPIGAAAAARGGHVSSSEEEEDEEELGLRRDDADHERFAALYCEMLDFTHCVQNWAVLRPPLLRGQHSAAQTPGFQCSKSTK
jgi:hypothetical protein